MFPISTISESELTASTFLIVLFTSAIISKKQQRKKKLFFRFLRTCEIDDNVFEDHQFRIGNSKFGSSTVGS